MIKKIFLFPLFLAFLSSCNTKIISPNLCPSVCDGLIAYYPFYGDSKDRSGNGYDLTEVGTKLDKDRNNYLNHSYNFNGKTDYLKFNDLSLLGLDDKSYSLSLWLEVEEPSQILADNWSERYIISSETRSLRIVMYYHGLNSKFSFSTRKNLENFDAFSANSKNVEYKKYYHIVGVLNREEKYLKLFINGELHEQNSIDGEIAASGNLLYIGADHWDNGKTNLKGNIDEIRIYSRPLSNLEVKKIYDFTSSFPLGN